MSKAYFYKLFRSPMLYIAILGVTAVCSTDLLNGWINKGSVIYHIDIFLGLDSYRKIVAVLGALPFAANFSEEWNNSVTNNCVVKCGIKKYAFSNVLFCHITSLLTVFIGMMIFAGLYSFFIPFYEFDPNPKVTPYGIFLDNGFPLIYMLARIFIFSASCAMWSVMGLLLSGFFPNKYIAVCSPFVASYIIERFTMQLPPFLNLYPLSLSFMDEHINPLAAFLYSYGLFALISAICGFAFYFIVRKKVNCEII